MCTAIYGMMLFEIISGRRNSELMESGAIRYFPVWAAIRISEGDISEILDPRLSAVNFQELERACKVANHATDSSNPAGHSRCQRGPSTGIFKTTSGWRIH